jgi:hypothetical protein
MFEAPCGCAIEDAAARSDPEAAAVLALDAIACKEAWRCPRATGCPPPRDASGLPPAQREALANVERLTGFKGGTTCPCFYASLDWVHEAVEAHDYWDKGQLQLIDDAPSSALLAAVRAVRLGISARKLDDAERRLREAEERNRKPPVTP